MAQYPKPALVPEDDPKQYLYWMIKSAEQDFPDAQLDMARHYTFLNNPELVRYWHDKAFQQYSVLAENGDRNAQHLMGVKYYGMHDKEKL